uniref:Uncharacterized protein n=1 Tax=Anopheles melas TaxID=34690 RepID=A0A182U0I8_9DIPT
MSGRMFRCVAAARILLKLTATWPSAGPDVTAPQQQQPQYEYVQQTGEGQQEQTQYQQQQPSYSVRGQQAPQPGTETDASSNAAKLIGVAFSPSNEVSQVKFSSAGLKYNF